MDSVTRYIFQPASGSGERRRACAGRGWLPEETWNYTYLLCNYCLVRDGSYGDNRTLKRTWSVLAKEVG